MSHKEVAAQIRNAVKAAGIAARVRILTSCGDQWVQVFGVNAAATFSEGEQAVVKSIAQGLGLTCVRGMAIDMDRATNPQVFNFVVPV